MSEDILFETKDQIAYVTLNREKNLNAINIDMFKKLSECWNTINTDDNIRVAIITGAGDKAFCAGMDLKEVSRIRKEGKDDLLKLVDDPFMEKMRTIDKPVISAINGNVFAGGFLIALNSDIRISVQNTTFAITEAKVGRGSPWAIPLLWMLPLGTIMELTLTGDSIPVEKMEKMGFVNYIVPKAELMPTAVKIAENIRNNAPLSVVAAKQSLMQGMDLGVNDGIKKAKEIHKKVYSSLDAQEGPRAFAEKRKPIWRNK